jgi:hypothetical protein
VNGLDQSRPQAIHFRALADLGRGSGGAETKTRIINIDANQSWNAFDVDERRWFGETGAKLNEEIGSTGEDLRTGIRRHQVHGLLYRMGCFIADCRHALNDSLKFAT